MCRYSVVKDHSAPSRVIRRHAIEDLLSVIGFQLSIPLPPTRRTALALIGSHTAQRRSARQTEHAAQKRAHAFSRPIGGLSRV